MDRYKSMKENVIELKSFQFAIRIVNLYKHLTGKKEYVLSKQILRSGTSVGANIKEAICGFSKADFRAKMSIAHKEINETEYWLRLLYETKYINDKEFNSLFEDAREINRILSKILITSSS
jgi:four helix bundle protein